MKPRNSALRALMFGYVLAHAVGALPVALVLAYLGHLLHACLFGVMWALAIMTLFDMGKSDEEEGR